jgi:hypothetical protein
MVAVRLTAGIQRTICAYIRSGAYPEIAAAAAGVDVATFRHWRALGTRRKARKIYKEFVAAVAVASAEARVAAELGVFKDDPKTWLTKGPGRETQDAAGWSGVVRPLLALSDNRTINLLADPGASAILTMLLAALVPYPEARKAVIAALNKGAAPALEDRHEVPLGPTPAAGRRRAAPGPVDPDDAAPHDPHLPTHPPQSSD